MIANLRRVLATTTPIRRLQFFVTLVLTAAGAAAELVTIGAVLPVLAIAAAPDTLDRLPLVGAILPDFAARLGMTPIMAAAALLVIAAIGATAIRLLLAWVSQKFVYGLQQDLVLHVYGRALRQSYGWYVRQNSSVLIAGMDKIYIVTVGVVAPLVLALTSAVMALCIIGFLFLIDPATALFASLSIGLIYVAISLLSKRQVFTASHQLAEVRTARIKALQETLGGIRDIILDQSQPVFEQALWRIEDTNRRLLVTVNFVAFAPRLVVEGTAILLVAVMAAWFSSQPGGMLGAIPVLGALALGAQRLLPLIQSIYLGWTSYSINAFILKDVVDLIDAPVESAAERDRAAPVRRFAQSIALANAGYRYVEGRDALRGINLTIAKGERIGLIGKTGSGKSTLVDILMGLLEPTSGALLIDGAAVGDHNLANWKAQVAHVPQTIFLADDSIAANIAFGSSPDTVDAARVDDAARQAGLSDFVTVLPEGLATRVGERGVRLSGGQRQRIGIARALYKSASVLILDEATSALDDETEAAVMQSVDQLDPDLTVILIAHRLSTVARCDRIYRLSDGQVVAAGTYDEVVGLPAMRNEH